MEAYLDYKPLNRSLTIFPQYKIYKHVKTFLIFISKIPMPLDNFLLLANLTFETKTKSKLVLKFSLLASLSFPVDSMLRVIS